MNKLDNVKVCLCKIGDEYLDLVHVEVIKENVYLLPVRTKIVIDPETVKFSVEDEKRGVGYIDHSYAYTMDDSSIEVYVSIEEDKYYTGLIITDLEL